MDASLRWHDGKGKEHIAAPRVYYTLLTGFVAQGDFATTFTLPELPYAYDAL